MRTEMNIFTRIRKYEVAIVSSIIIMVNLVVGFFVSKPFINTVKNANIETTAVVSNVGGGVKHNWVHKTIYHTTYTFTDNHGNERIVHERDKGSLLGMLLYKNGQHVKFWYNTETGDWRTRYTDFRYGITMFWLGIFLLLGIIILKKGIEIAKTEV